jgi:histone acetyltransferase (RNA polymerase elongator complex component)
MPLIFQKPQKATGMSVERSGLVRYQVRNQGVEKADSNNKKLHLKIKNSNSKNQISDGLVLNKQFKKSDNLETCLRYSIDNMPKILSKGKTPEINKDRKAQNSILNKNLDKLIVISSDVQLHKRSMKGNQNSGGGFISGNGMQFHSPQVNVQNVAAHSASNQMMLNLKVPQMQLT